MNIKNEIMAEGNKLFSKVKDIAILVGFILTIGTVLITWSNERTKRALLEDQVKRNTEILTNYDLKLIDYRLNEIDDKLNQVLILLTNE